MWICTVVRVHLYSRRFKQIKNHCKQSEHDQPLHYTFVVTCCFAVESYLLCFCVCSVAMLTCRFYVLLCLVIAEVVCWYSSLLYLPLLVGWHSSFSAWIRWVFDISILYLYIAVVGHCFVFPLPITHWRSILVFFSSVSP